MGSKEMICRNCVDWEEGMSQISGAQVLAYMHGIEYTFKTFRFCPWCGTELIVKEASDD